jgi:hypothetical protein
MLFQQIPKHYNISKSPETINMAIVEEKMIFFKLPLVKLKLVQNFGVCILFIIHPSDNKKALQELRCVYGVKIPVMCSSEMLCKKCFLL